MNKYMSKGKQVLDAWKATGYAYPSKEHTQCTEWAKAWKPNEHGYTCFEIRKELRAGARHADAIKHMINKKKYGDMHFACAGGLCYTKGVRKYNKVNYYAL